MPTADVNGTTLYYEVHGSGFPLVFVHGGFGGLGTGAGGATPGWLPRFSNHFRVILYDRRSAGRSAFPDTAHTMEQFAGDIRGLLAHLGFEQAHVWGTSAGGQITLAFGLEYPAAARSLVITESAPWVSRDAELLRRLRERISVLQTDGPDAAYEARRDGGTVGLNLFAASRPAQDENERREREARRAAIQAQLAAVPREERVAKYAGELRTYAAYADWDASARLHELGMPVLVVAGTADTVFPGVDWQGLAAGRPNVTCRSLAGAEHGRVITPETLDDILAFLRSNTPR